MTNHDIESHPLFSIITISYNNAGGLKETLQSIRSQKEKDFELIVIDGGSDDNTKEVVGQYMDIVSVFVSEKDRGIAHAFNKGTILAKGILVNYLNSGDLFLNDSVLSFVKASYIEHKWKWAYGLGKRVDKYGNIYTARASELKHYSYIDLSRSNLGLSHQATFIELEVVREVGLYNEEYQFLAMDYDLLLKISKKYTPIEFHKYLILFNDFGTGSVHFHDNLITKHRIRVKHLHLSKIFSMLYLIKTYVSILKGMTRKFIKKILIKTYLGKRVLKIENI